MTGKMHQIHFWPGLFPDPAGGAHDAPPDPLVGWGGGYPSPFLTPLDAYGVSFSAPLAPRPEPPLQHIATLTTGCKHDNSTAVLSDANLSKEV